MKVANQMNNAIDFSSYIFNCTRDFTGRDWVFTKIEQWLADPNAPHYFFIEGEPGIGKSAIAAQLTKIRNLATIHFCIARQAETIDPFNFVLSVSRQLMNIDSFAQCILEEEGLHLNLHINVSENYGQFTGVQIENLIVEAPSASIAFNRFVFDPLMKLYSCGFKEQIVLLVDALDEAVQWRESQTIIDLLTNARGLPAQIRFILTSRPESTVLNYFEQYSIPHLVLNAGQCENLQDMHRYVERKLGASLALQAQLKKQGMQQQSFIEWSVNASQGNFLYLTWLLTAVEKGDQEPNDLVALPKGLDNIYREFFITRNICRDRDKWRVFYRPLFGILAAAQEALSIEQITYLSGLELQIVRDFLYDIEQFLDTFYWKTEKYQLYHQSLIDYLSDRARGQEFWVDVQTAHLRIVKWYFRSHSKEWGGCDDYGIRYILTHIKNSDDQNNMVRLLDTNYIKCKAKQLNYTSALADAKLIAYYIGSSPETDFDHLLKAADVYCKLREHLRDDYKSLESLIETCKDEQVLDWIDSETDLQRKGILALGVAGLLTGQGRVKAASKLIEQYLPIWKKEEYNFSQICLAHALLKDAKDSLPKPFVPHPVPETSHGFLVEWIKFPNISKKCDPNWKFIGKGVPTRYFLPVFITNDLLWMSVACSFFVCIGWVVTHMSQFSIEDKNSPIGGPFLVALAGFWVFIMFGVPIIQKAVYIILKRYHISVEKYTTL